MSPEFTHCISFLEQVAGECSANPGFYLASIRGKIAELKNSPELDAAD
jgi:hypothetical protein